MESNAERSKASIISNADTWLHPPVAYSQSAYHNGYRQDCSSYVSMVCQLGASATTWTIPTTPNRSVTRHHIPSYII